MQINYNFTPDEIKTIINKYMVGLVGGPVNVTAINFNLDYNDRDPYDRDSSQTQFVSSVSVSTIQDVKIK